MLKVTKKYGFTLSLENLFLEKLQAIGSQIDLSSSLFRVNLIKDLEFCIFYMLSYKFQNL